MLTRAIDRVQNFEGGVEVPSHNRLNHQPTELSAVDTTHGLFHKATMSRSDGGVPEHRMLRRAGKLLDNGVQMLQAGSLDGLQSHVHQRPSPPLFRSLSTSERPRSWNAQSVPRRGSLLSAPSPLSVEPIGLPVAPGSRQDASRDPSSHGSQTLAIPDLIKVGGGAGPTGPNGFRSRSSPSVITLSTIRRMSNLFCRRMTRITNMIISTTGSSG